MTTFQNFNPKQIRLTEEDAASLAALRGRAEDAYEQGEKAEAWELNTRALRIINRATVKTLSTGEYTMNDALIFFDIPQERPTPDPTTAKKGAHLSLMLIDGSPLARAVLDLLEKDMEDGSVI